MRNINTILFTLLTLSAFSQDAYLDLVFTGTNVSVGDEISVFVKSTDNNSATPSLIQFDLEYNNALLTKVSTTYSVLSNGTNSTAQTANSSFASYQWSDGSAVAAAQLSDLYAGWNSNSAGYSSANDWNVERITIQDGQDIVHGNLVEIKFTVKDRSSSTYTDYSNMVKLNWGRMVDNSDNTNYDVDSQTDAVGISAVAGVNAGAVTINVQSPHSNKDKMQYKIYDVSQTETVNGIVQPKSGENPLLSGDFDNSGAFQTSTLSLNGQYYIDIDATDGGSGWMDNIATVTDAYKAFQYAIATDINGGSTGIFEYDLQKVLGDVTADGNVTIDDSFEFLAHINGYTVSSDISTANASTHYNGLMSDYGLEDSNWGTKLFTVTETAKTFNFGHAFRGDLDFSHSTEPTNAGGKNDNFTVSSIINPNTGKNMVISNSSQPDEIYSLDIASSIVDGKVELNINLGKEDLVGTQFNIVYDNSILEFESITYDSGNDMTNFSRSKDNKLWIGSLDYNGEKTIKTGTPYKVVFNMITPVNNTAGLINYTVTEGVNANGTKVNFNIQ